MGGRSRQAKAGLIFPARVWEDVKNELGSKGSKRPPQGYANTA